ncbi:phenylalanyl-tRNA synthetase, alpha subunit [Helicobacter bizzozeronii CIII-1]|uniref:Phenylalanyl-tRNA synthetase, alpha subunit n=1 Tax=Helicobacter bizzozeronii (strain CIII-1) TaxID=1002804 RepID=F8KTW6_HELBC|nr:hypothetical protein [Helicobacter bizzozeronii]CCB80293.1 phenylalanyl-tRNA synthetase, alpha subunit [Helicobacter bizzozeronii CIII-1]
MQTLKNLLAQIQEVSDLKGLEALRLQVLGKKGELTQEFSALKNLEGKQKAQKAQELNQLKEAFTHAHASKKKRIARFGARG